MFLIRNGAGPHPVDGFESNWIYTDDTGSKRDERFFDELGVTGDDVARKTIDPSTGRLIDWKTWSIEARWHGFAVTYQLVERQYTTVLYQRMERQYALQRSQR